MRAVTYQFAEITHKQSIIELLAVNSPFIPPHLREALFDWQFLTANPRCSEARFCLTASVDGQLAGVNGFMPVDVLYDGQKVAGAWSCDTLVTDAFRGMGVGKGLLAKISLEAAVVLGYGISDMSDPILLKLGWKSFDGVDTYFYFDQEAGARGLVKNGMSRTKALFGRFSHKPSDVLVANLAGPFKDEHGQLWEQVAPQYSFAVVRDVGYLNWRYRAHPTLRYDVLEARRQGKLVALMILRHDNYESVIADFVGDRDDEGVMHSLLSRAIADLTVRGTSRIRCETSLPKLKDSLKVFGFRNYKVPSRFKYYHADPALAVEQPDWFIMTGDSDNESSQVGKIFERSGR